VSRELPSSPYRDFLGIRMLEYGDGLAECLIGLQAHHLNTGGRVHGGVLASLADTAAGVAVRSIRPEGKLSATTDLSISFIRPPKGNDLLARAKVIHAGKQLFRVEVDILSADKLVARANATFMIVAAFEKA
jgi:uncharacterized protein (TIGR00369 family)